MSSLSDFFQLIAEEKKQKKEEFNSLIGDLELNPIFEEVNALKKINKEKKEKQEKTLESFESFLFSEKVEKPKSKKKVAKPQVKEKNEIVVEEPKEELIEKSLGLLSEPSTLKQQNDPLTPTDQKFATFEDLQKHYNLFLNRIQQQLSTLGGGGETNLAYMDMPLKYVTSSSYTITPQDYYIGVNYAGRVNITLPTPRKNGKVYIVKDERGEASKGNNRHIYIYPSGTDLIDGEDYVVLAYDFGSLTFVYRDGWRVV
jgi:hypothetical protein